MRRAAYVGPSHSLSVGSLLLRRFGFVVILMGLTGGIAFGDLGASYVTRIGRLGFLCDVHGLDLGGITVAPVGPVASLFGCSVTYDPPTLFVRRADGTNEIEMKLGSALAKIRGSETYMSAPMLVFSETQCAPIRFVVESLGGRVDYEEYSLFGSGPAVRLTINGEVYYILVHRQAPDAVAQFVADMQHTVQTDVIGGGRLTLGMYGVDWVVRVNELELDMPYFASSSPCFWDDNPPFYCGWYDPKHPDADLPAGFWSNAAGIYTSRAGKWQFLVGTQDCLTYADCERAGLPVYLAESLGLEPFWQSGPIGQGEAPTTHVYGFDPVTVDTAMLPTFFGFMRALADDDPIAMHQWMSPDYKQEWTPEGWEPAPHIEHLDFKLIAQSSESGGTVVISVEETVRDNNENVEKTIPWEIHFTPRSQQWFVTYFE